VSILPKLVELCLFKHFRKQSLELFMRTVPTILKVLHDGFTSQEEVAVSGLLTRHGIDLDHFDVCYFHHL
jgi:hypothetical protein